MFAVAGKTQHRSDDKLRRAPRARTFHRAFDNVETSRKIGAIDAVTFESVTDRAFDQIGAGKLTVVRRRIGVMIVRCDNDQRNLLNGRDVHSFVKRSGLHSPFTDAGQAHKILFAAKTFSHQRADGYRNHCAKVADHGETILSGPTAMNVPVATAHWAKPGAEICSRDVDQRLAEC